MIYIWKKAREGDTKEIMFDLSFDVQQAEKRWEVLVSRDNVESGWRDSARHAWEGPKRQKELWLEHEVRWP